MQSRFQVRIFPMKPNDVIISGSDGRDDILLGVDDHGNRIINEDEYSFLRAVEAGDGLLGEIEKLLRSEGEITDDLSLVRIAYKEDFPAEALPSQDVEKLREDAARSFESKDFQKAADLYLRCSEVSPEDTELLYAVSRSLKSASGGKKSVLLRAAEFGERCSLRSPDMIKNLVNLADIQRLLGNSDRVRELASRALELNPSEEKARKILESLPGGR